MVEMINELARYLFSSKHFSSEEGLTDSIFIHISSTVFEPMGNMSNFHFSNVLELQSTAPGFVRPEVCSVLETPSKKKIKNYEYKIKYQIIYLFTIKRNHNKLQICKS